MVEIQGKMQNIIHPRLRTRLGICSHNMLISTIIDSRKNMMRIISIRTQVMIWVTIYNREAVTINA